GTEVASWYSQKRNMQNAADLGADSGVLSLKKNYPGSNTFDGYAQNEARTGTSAHGFTDGASSTTVTVNIPPTSGSYTGSAYNHKAVEVIITKPASLLFSGLFLPTAPTVVARAVATISTSAGDCMLALDPTASKAFNVQGNVTIDVDCGMASRSSASDAFDVTGASASITAPTLRV